MLDKFRSSKYYKICGFICGAISVFLSLLFYLLFFSDFFKGENILIALPILAVSMLIFVIDALIFVILTNKAYLSAYSKENNNNTAFNIIADIGYLFSTAFFLFILCGLCYFCITFPIYISHHK